MDQDFDSVVRKSRETMRKIAMSNVNAPTDNEETTVICCKCNKWVPESYAERKEVDVKTGKVGMGYNVSFGKGGTTPSLNFPRDFYKTQVQYTCLDCLENAKVGFVQFHVTLKEEFGWIWFQLYSFVFYFILFKLMIFLFKTNKLQQLLQSIQNLV